MNILLVSATFFEIRPLLTQLHLVEQYDEYLSTYHHKDTVVDVLIPGVGMVQTAYFLGRQLALKQYDLAVNAGVAGTFNKSIPLGSVVNVIEDCVPELGAEDGANFLSVFELGLTDPDAYPYKGGRLINAPLNAVVFDTLEVIKKLPEVKALTSNTVHGDAENIARIRRISGADLESMEGAAFFFGCFSAKMPCLQIRSVSNLVEERDKSRWDLDLALKNLNKVLWEIITSPRGGS
ncbi:MAG: futalosine hydrolase [Bacteroidales bacterium]